MHGKRLLYALALFGALATSSYGALLGRPVCLLWDYTTALGAGVVASAFIVQRCQAVPDCFSNCTPIDQNTVSPVLIGPNASFYDINVVAGNSYRYQIRVGNGEWGCNTLGSLSCFLYLCQG